MSTPSSDTGHGIGDGTSDGTGDGTGDGIGHATGGHAAPAPPEEPEGGWDGLRATAVEAATHAYAPYSGFPVGAAARVDDGRVVAGCNVENAGYGVTLCAECGLVGQLHLTGGGRLTHFVCVNGASEVIMPCGRCRQLLWENGGASLRLMTPEGVLTMAQVLPQAFGPEDLHRV